MAKEKEKAQKTKRPSAKKRQIQGEKRRLINKSFKSEVRTAVREFEAALASKDKTKLTGALNAFYSYMDKGVKRGQFKLNKANRSKARAAAKVAAIS